ncbi:hypothetical protein F5148DRAFT_319694 [Russula earlei]|uniref:Uncharacterized protein n=1 Tax=Russula earlei TaxID=71964 RepID=A0ACC0U3C9_9AGAM|nr:hypothetical protein F5148DRAFT_319694 [Russula earlei]
MVKWYYTVIVGTQPGVYGDWYLLARRSVICELTDQPCRTQVAPKVSEISGAIHKKFKTYAEAWEAFNRAAREGSVRVVRLDPEPEVASLAPAHHCTEETGLSREAYNRCTIARPTPRPVTVLQRRFPRNDAPTNIFSSTHAGPSDLAGRINRISTELEPRGTRLSNQGPRNESGHMYGAERPESTHATSVDRTGLVGNERWQEGHRVTARPTRTSIEPRRLSQESPRVTNDSMHILSRLHQIEDDQDNGSQVHTRGGQHPHVNMPASPRSNGEGEL